MADGHKVITRILEYSGPEEWLEKTMAASRMPIQGVKQFPDGSYIKGGVIMWQPVEMEGKPDDVNEQAPVEQQPAKTVTFKRPGE